MKRLYKSKNSQKSTLVFYKLHKKLKVFITIVCLISILFNYVPWNLVSATTVSESQIIPESNSELQNEIVEQDIFENDYLDNSLVPVDFEVVDKRTEYEKHFRKIDGTYEVGIYNQAVHYLNNGLWKDIDNSLNEYETTLETKANKFKLEFPKKLDDNKQIKLKMDNYNINWKVLGIDKTDAYYQNGQIKSTNLKELTNVSQSVKYNNIQNNVDIEYIVAGSDIKENIILNEYVPNFSISFEYKLKDLEIVQNDEGNVLFVNEDNETIFTFEELFMFDKNENVSFDLDYEIQDTGNNTYVITITPDDDWLSKANYPVVIDPTLKSGTTSMSIYDTYVSESNPDTNYSSSSIMTISNISSTDEFRGLINFSIPSSIINKVITYSHLNLTGRQAYSGGQINVYKNTQSFNPSTVTWNLRPNHDSRVVDYYTIVGTNNKYIFDITKPVKEWQATGNPMTTGFTIAEDEWQGKYISVNQMESYTEGDRPLITIGYEEPAGLKDYWTYTSQDMGMLGTGYISDYTGNLTFVRNDFTLKNEYTSLSLDFFYNNYSRSTDIGYGAGWRNNFNIEVKLDTTSNKYYMFKPDGNKVYFMNESCSPEYYGSTNFNCTSISEDGSRIILKRSYNSYGNTTIQITTKSDFDFNFDSGGRLISIRDIKTNRYIRIYYIDSSLKIDYVKDDADNRIDFTYNADNSIKIELMLKQSNGTLRSVEEKNYFFDSYNNIDLITQGFRYGTSSNSMVYDNTLQYEFDSDHKFLNGYNENNNYKIEYQYNTNKKVNKVITSYRDSLKQIGQFDIVYNFNKTTYTNYTGISIYYTFDNYGHTINITDDYGNTTFYKYSGLFTNINNRRENGYDLLNLEPNYYNNHKLLESSDVIKQQQNPITNHGFESKNEDWVEVGWTKYPGSDGIIEFTSSEAMLGDRSLKIQKVSSSVYASQEIYLKDGTYTVVAWIKNDGTTPGAYVDILNADIKQAITKVDNSDRWVKYQLSFTLTSSKNVTVKLVNDSVSSAYFDNIQILEGSIDTDTLQESTVDSRYNSLLNNSFETGSTGWSLFSFSVVNINETGIMEDILGKKAVCIVGDGSSEYRFEQEITSLVTQGETYMVGGWAKANAVPNKGAFNGSIPTSDGRFFGYNVYIYNEPLDGTTPYWSITYLPFDSSVDTWQYQMKTFEVPTIAKSVIITGVYKGEGTAYFDNIQLYHDKIGTDYSYDTKGNLVSVENKNGEVTSYKYDTNDKVIEVTSNDITTYIDRNSTFQIEEVARNNVRSTLEYNQTTKQVTSAYVGYDKNVTIQEQDKWFKTSTTYTADYQYVKTLKDEFGNITTTNIDPTVALITSITDALGNSQSFEYDEHGRLVTTNSNDVNGNSMQVSYEYLNGRLWKITREDLVYEFIYNNLEQLEQVKIANVTVMSYDYVEENKNDVMYYTDILNSQTYENGDIVSFEYTDEDEIKTIKFNNEIRFSYEYDSSGRLSIFKDVHNNNIYFYSYDLSGKLKVITDKDGNTIEYQYDKQGNVSDYTYNISGIVRGVQYHYNNQTGEYDYTSYSVSETSIKNEYNYDADSLRRLNNIKLTIGANYFTKKIIYDDNKVVSSMGNATSRIYSIEYLKNDSIQNKHIYSYDDNNNIISIIIKSSTGQIIDQYDYEYDGFKQLKVEDVWINKGETKYSKYYYYYDTRGNITDVKTFLYGQDDYITLTIPSFYEENNGYREAKMYYNGSNEYDDIYSLNVGESPSLYFTYSDPSYYQPIYGMYTTQVSSNLNTSKEGYYYREYRATDNSYTIYFRIVFKVGNPIAGPTIPQEHIRYHYENTWKDQLTGYGRVNYVNGVAQQEVVLQGYEYDNQGNPTKITNYKYNGTTYYNAKLEYDGRQLTKITVYNDSLETNKIETISYKYNDQGIRTEKIIGSQTTKYVVDGDKVLVEENGTDIIYYTYDVDGTLLSMNLNGNEYFYITNMQGDIIELVDIAGNTVVLYRYDAWGNFVSTKEYDSNGVEKSLDVAKKNPFRYRGYRYEEETGWYYLNSRYYNPEIGRFISADGQLNEGILGKNMYAYTENNPVMYIDINGDFPWSFINENLNYYQSTILIDFGSNLINAFKEHTKNARNSTKGKHQKGQTRRQKDNFGEKGDLRRNPNPNKRITNNNYVQVPIYNENSFIEFDSMKTTWWQDNWQYVVGGGIIVVGTIVLVVLVADDATGVGVADDPLIPAIIAFIGKGCQMVFG